MNPCGKEIVFQKPSKHPKTPTRRPKKPLRRPKDTPKMLPDASKMSPRRPKMFQDTSAYTRLSRQRLYTPMADHAYG